ncbi:general substrate transporter [Lipomyces doorenjongii]
MIELGHLANQEDHELSKWQAIRQHSLAFAWCLFAIWTILLVSFENQALGNILGIPEFRKDFICMEFAATTNVLFFGGKFLNGFTTGSLASVTVTDIGEVWPIILPILSYTLGPFTVALIVNSTETATTRWAYCAIFCAQYGFAFVATTFVFFMPESPWWYASRDQDNKALQSLRQLGYKNGLDEKRLAVIKLTLEEIKIETEGATYLECFRRSNLRRTLISISGLAIQSLSGLTFAASFSTYYMQLAGYILSMIGNVMSWYLVDRVGRRSLTIYGLVILTVILVAVAATPGVIKGTVAMISVQPHIPFFVKWPRLVFETKPISIGIPFQYFLNCVWSFVLPYLFNKDRANLGAKVAFIFGGLALLGIGFLWLNLPERA